MLMSSGGYAASSSGCVTRPRAREIGSTVYAGPTQHSLLIGRYVMATAEHREPCDSRGSCTVLGAPRGEIPPGDSTFAAESNQPQVQPCLLCLRSLPRWQAAEPDEKGPLATESASLIRLPRRRRHRLRRPNRF